MTVSGANQRKRQQIRDWKHPDALVYGGRRYVLVLLAWRLIKHLSYWHGVL